MPFTSPLSPRLDLTKLLAPRSIAVIGASDQPGNLGGVAVGLLRRLGYPGEIWPVNPKRSEVHGLRCFPDAASLPAPADLAIIATGASSVAQRVAECAAAGIRHGIAWAGGFAEVGGEGVALQATLTETCLAHDFLLAGPNCIGIVDAHLPMTASFASFLLEMKALLRGSISMVSQSGGLATMAQALAQENGFGFRYMISSGNEAVITIPDYIEALAADSETKVIAIYLEGVRDGARFLAALRTARSAGKPVIMLKGGASEASARAAASHTGALAGEKRVWEAVFRETGAIPVHSLEGLLDMALFLSSADLAKLPRGRGVAMITTGGGIGVLSADQCAVHGLTVPRLSPSTQAALRPLAPPIAAIDNPVDFTPQVYNQAEWFGHFGAALDTIAADPDVAIVLIQFGPMGTRALDVASAICDFRDRTAKTVCIAWTLAPPGVTEALRARGVHVFREYARAIATLGNLAQSRTDAPPRAAVAPLAFDWRRFVPEPTAGLVISEHRCHEILAAAGLDVAVGRLARSVDEALAAAESVKAPVAMKGISPAVTHRAAAGLLRLGLNTPDEIRRAHTDLSARARASGIALDGIYVQHMVSGGIEILLSAFRDPVFGPIVSCGAGGNLTELIDDVVLERAPIDVATAEHALQRLRIVKAARKLAPTADLRLLAEAVSFLSRLAAAAPWRRFVLEINPVKWGEGYVTAVDGLLIIEEP